MTATTRGLAFGRGFHGLALPAMGVVAMCVAAPTVQAGDGGPQINLRTRYEHVEVDGPLRQADALTTQIKLGATRSFWEKWTALFEFEGVYATGGQNYLSAPGLLEASNGNSSYPLVPDPSGTDLNRAQIQWKEGSLDLTLGRQRIIQDNARFVGNVGWRQDEQTFDALRVQYTPTAQISLDYSYVWQQNFIFFNSNRMQTHLLRLGYTPSSAVALGVFAYAVDFDEDSGRIPGAPDHLTLGLTASGKAKGLSYRASYASQSDTADAPSSVDADYLALELAYAIGPIAPTLGYERLSGDGSYGFQTPFGTNHKFQGFADVFVAATPASGIEDLWVGLSGGIGKAKLGAAYHQFTPDTGAEDLGSEIDLSLAYPLAGGVGLLLKAADYSADSFGSDTQRLWVQLSYSL